MDKIGELFGKTVRARERDGLLEITDGSSVTTVAQPWLAAAVMRTFRHTGDGALGDLHFPVQAPAAPEPPPPASVTAPPPIVVPDAERADHPGQPPVTTTDWAAVLTSAAANAPAAAPPLPIEGEALGDYAARVLADTGVTLASAVKADAGYAKMLVDTMRTRALDSEWGDFLTAVASVMHITHDPPPPAESSSSAAPA